MRFSLVDLALGCITCGLGCACAIALARFQGVAVPLIVQIAAGGVAYLLVTPLLYRAFRLRPLLLPRCPNCRDSDRHWWSVSFDWPIEIVECAICKDRVELHYAPCGRLQSPIAPAFELKWPHSFGSRWRRVK